MADLASRLRALPVVALTAPDDALLRAVLVKLFADRQLAVDESLVSFLATRIERSFAAARAAVATARPRGAAAAASGHPGAGRRSFSASLDGSDRSGAHVIAASRMAAIMRPSYRLSWTSWPNAHKPLF